MKISWDKVRKFITLENIILTITILVIWILFSLPVIFFYISNDEIGTGWIVNINEFVELLDQACINNISNNTGEYPTTEPAEGCSRQSGKKVL